MTTTGLMLLALGLILGFFIAWFAASARLRDAETRAAAAETTAASLREQRGSEQTELRALRDKLEAEQKARTAAETALEAERKNLEAQRKLLDDAEATLSNVFKAISADVLGQQSEQFLKIAEGKFSTLRAEAEGDLGKRQEAINGLITPLKEALDRYEAGIKQIESSRQEAYGTLREQLLQLSETQRQLQQETAKLVTALRKPQVRGRWGEVTLRRLAELAGMVAHCDFIEQEGFPSEEGLRRPDMIVNLPGERQIVVDAKVALDAYLDAIEVTNEAEKESHLNRHATQVRRHMEQLGSKAYWDRLPKAPEFTVLFLPGDPFLGAAVERDPRLIEDGMARRVVIATPATLIALLLAVYHGWRQEEITKNAQQISELGKELYDRIATLWGHLDDLRAAIDKAVEAWNRVVGSLEGRVLPSVRKFRELGATTAEEIPATEQVERTTRVLPSPPDPES